MKPVRILRGLMRRQPLLPDLAALKAAMVAAHPDKGSGSAAAFIRARANYVAARRVLRRKVAARG